MKQNKKLIKTPMRHTHFKESNPNVMHTDTQSNRNSRPLKDTALKTEANKMFVWLYSPQCFLNGKRRSEETCVIHSALLFCCPNEL